MTALNEIETFFLLKMHEFFQTIFLYPYLTSFMIFCSSVGNKGIVWLILAGILLLFKKTRIWGISILFSLIIGVVLGELILKNLVGRLRPFQYSTDFLIQIPPPHGFSFPSGHTASSFASATALFHYHKPLGIGAYILALLIGFSRIYLMVHFPIDVLFGIGLGIFSGHAGYLLSNRLSKKEPTIL